MSIRYPRYSKEEFARRGDEIYATQVLPKIEECVPRSGSLRDRGKIAAIDIETGDFEIDKSEIVACDRLETRRPHAQIWVVRVGSHYIRRLRDRS